MLSTGTSDAMSKCTADSSIKPFPDDNGSSRTSLPGNSAKLNLNFFCGLLAPKVLCIIVVKK